MKRHTFESRNDIEIQTSKHEFTENTTIHIRQRKSCDFISDQAQLTDRKIKIPANSEESTSKWGKIPGYKTPEDVARMPPCVLNQLSRDKRFERLRRRSGSEDTSCARFEVAVRDGADKNQRKDGEECENSLFNADYNFVDKNDWGNSLGSSLIDSIRNTVHKFVRKEDLNIYTDNTEWDSPNEKRSYLDLDNIPAFPKETKNATIIPICKMRAEKEAGLCKFCRQNSLKQFKDISDDSDNKKGGEEIKLVITSEKISDSNLTRFVPKRAMSQHSEKTSRSNLTKFVPKRAYSEHNLKIDQKTTSDDTRVNIHDEDSDGCESDSKNFGSLFKNCDMIPCPRNLLCDQGLHSGRCHEEVRRKLSVPICRDDECACRKMDFMKNDLWLGRVNRGVVVCKSVGALETSLTGAGFMAFGEYFNKSRAGSCQDSENVINRVIVENEEFVVEKEGEEKDGNLDGTPSSSSSSTTTVSAPQCRHLSHRARDATSIDSIMNGMNGHHHLYHQHSNGDLNGGGTCGGDIITQNQQKGCWTIGLINSKYRYLTAETFGFKINANGASLKKKQIWTLEPVNSNSSDSLIYLRSHLDKYLAVDSFGNVTCESEEKDPGSKFQISVADDGSGRWALKNVVRGYFLGSSADKLTCTAKVPSDAEFWHVHLAARPQMNLRSVGRKRFAHLSENLDEIHVDANIPWGEDTLFTLEFRLDESGKYAIHTCNNKYLSLGGKLIDQCTKDCLFSAEYHSGQLALRDRAGSYLSPIGSKAVLKTRSNTVTRDELFSLEDSLPQASFVANLNARFVSVKQGVDLTANQDEISDHETFQLEFDWTTKRWYIRTMQDRYWTLETGGGIQASGDKRSSNALFDLAWQQDGSVAFRANNGRYVMTKRSGHLYATADIVDDNSKYYFYLINRPILVLKCEQGFVGYKSAASNKLECNKATYECIQVERGDKGVVYFKGQNGKYWHVDAEGVTADADAQEGFHLELREPTRLCIKACGGGGGSYLTASKNGIFRLGDANFEAATQWEY